MISFDTDATTDSVEDSAVNVGDPAAEKVQLATNLPGNSQAIQAALVQISSNVEPSTATSRTCYVRSRSRASIAAGTESIGNRARNGGDAIRKTGTQCPW